MPMEFDRNFGMSWKGLSVFNFFDWSGSFTSITCPIAYWMTRWGLFSLITGEPISKTIFLDVHCSPLALMLKLWER